MFRAFSVALVATAVSASAYAQTNNDSGDWTGTFINIEVDGQFSDEDYKVTVPGGGSIDPSLVETYQGWSGSPIQAIGTAWANGTEVAPLEGNDLRKVLLVPEILGRMFEVRLQHDNLILGGVPQWKMGELDQFRVLVGGQNAYGAEYVGAAGKVVRGKNGKLDLQFTEVYGIGQAGWVAVCGLECRETGMWGVTADGAVVEYAFPGGDLKTFDDLKAVTEGGSQEAPYLVTFSDIYGKDGLQHRADDVASGTGIKDPATFGRTLPPHTQVRLQATVHLVDDWQGDTGSYLKIPPPSLVADAVGLGRGAVDDLGIGIDLGGAIIDDDSGAEAFRSTDATRVFAGFATSGIPGATVSVLEKVAHANKALGIVYTFEVAETLVIYQKSGVWTAIRTPGPGRTGAGSSAHFDSAQYLISHIDTFYADNGGFNDRFALFGAVIGVNTTKKEKEVPLSATLD